MLGVLCGAPMTQAWQRDDRQPQTTSAKRHLYWLGPVSAGDRPLLGETGYSSATDRQQRRDPRRQQQHAQTVEA